MAEAVLRSARRLGQVNTPLRPLGFSVDASKIQSERERRFAMWEASGEAASHLWRIL